MTQDTNGRRDGGPAADSLGRAASAAASAGSEFLARAMELSGRQIADAIIQALKPAGTNESGGRIESLLARYRDGLGELALHLPMVARRLVQLTEEPPGSLHWLFRATLYAERPEPEPRTKRSPISPMPKLDHLTAVEVAPGKSVSVFMTDSVRNTLQKAYRYRPEDTPPAIVDAVAFLTKDEKVRNIPKLLDSLKFAFRRKGLPALQDVLATADWLRKKQTVAGSAYIKKLRATLGERCAGELLQTDVFLQFVGKPMPEPAGLVDQLITAFSFAGITLSRELIVIAERQRWLVLDHVKKQVFEARHGFIKPSRRPPPVSGATKLKPNEPCVDVFCSPRYPYRGTSIAGNTLLPARVTDASHGITVWSADRQLVQEHLNASGQRRLRAWDIGENRTPMALFMTEHREGDLGSYLELGLMCFVTPRKDPLAVGMIVVHDILATKETLGLRASNEIWAANKAPAELQFQPDDNEARMILKDYRGRKKLLTFTVPRGGDGTSSNVPLFLYTYKGEILHRTIITRSGDGESVRAGEVGTSLEVHNEPAKSEELSLIEDLRHFGIIGKIGERMQRPLFSAWSEHVSAELPRPDPVYEREDDD